RTTTLGEPVIRIKEQRTIPMTQQDAFAFIADFTNVVDWDPGITASEKVGNAPVGVGTEFNVVSNFAGRSLPLVYVVEEWGVPERAVLFTTTSRFDGRDTITFRPTDAGTEIDYVAEFRFKGLMRLVEPFLKGAFSKIGRDAMNGIVDAVGARTS
ncbi:MAG: SRPBCC family protein, partial [Acidimicrobiia bacterium]|nr:SRPBCC family protein [Acidimicrobiia bacterium]